LTTNHKPLLMYKGTLFTKNYIL